MFLRNYDNIIAAWTWGGLGTQFIDGSTKAKSTGGIVGDVLLVHDGNSIYPFKPQGGSYGKTKAVVGNGDTAVSYDDYVLDNQLAITATLAVTLPTYDSTTGKWVYVNTISITNNTVDAVAVSEYGIVLDDVRNIKSYLIYREVLDTPITLAAGANATIEFIYSYDANPNKPTA